MFYFRFTADTPYCGTENTDYRKFEERPTDAELEEAILDPFFDSFYRTEKVKRMTFLNPESSMYYKTSHITREKAYRSWRRIQIQRGLEDRLK